MSKEIIMNKRDLWHSQVANLNFELDENELVAEALKRGFVTQVGVDQYKINQNYKSRLPDDI